MARTKSEPGRRPDFDVFIVDGDKDDKDDKAFWYRVGAAWSHEDQDGYSLSLVAVPLKGRLVLRRPKPATERESGDDQRG